MHFFRREPKKATSASSARTKSLQDIFAPIPVAEVTESTWNDWEDSVAFQNSHPNLTAAEAPDSTYATEPQNLPAVDPFATVTKKGN